MNTKTIGILIVIVVLAGGAMFFFNAQRDSSVDTSRGISQDSPTRENTNQPSEQIPTANNRYIEYSPEALADNVDKKRVLFFHAAWCPTCKAAEQDFLRNADQIPEDVVVLKTDYDRERALKQQYEVTYQHTFVQLDTNGNEVTKWNGGSTALLEQSIQ